MSRILESLVNTSYISRRNFLIGSAIASSSVLLEKSTTEHLREFESNNVILDWGATTEYEVDLNNLTMGVEQTELADNERIAEELLGEGYMSMAELVGKKGPGYIGWVLQNSHRFTGNNSLKEHGERFISYAMEEYPLAAMVHGMLAKYSRHGAMVANSRNKLVEYLDFKPTPNRILPMQKFIKPRLGPDGSAVITNERGDFGLALRVDWHDLGSFVASQIGEKSLLTFAQQGGDIDIFSSTSAYDLNRNLMQTEPYIEVRGAYQKDRAYDNMSGMMEFIEYIDGVLGAAYGNSEEQGREAYNMLIKQGLWKRAFMFNQAMPHSIKRVDGTIQQGYLQWDGTDNPMFSVNNQAFNEVIPFYGWGSTRATVVGTTIIDLALATGSQQYEIDSCLRELSVPIVDLYGQEIRVIDNPNRVKEFFSERRF